ncbi:hypothetical protein D6T70_09180 [Kurthia gibsonii]|uniref:hypothetical protein n=1 Tax=Kurthia gibsonii TaxID=33946 RepID=UPI000EB1550D|nr:hypothetical protein [Kurthia gibsonii]RXH51912.1 hypothetical protein D6T70_09180 [Kurthia gibsonii]
MCARYTCPVCGYDGLEEPMYYENFAGSNEICACCGFEFGVDDFDCDTFEHEGLTEREIVEESHRIWREKWINDHFELFDVSAFPKEKKNGRFLKEAGAIKQLNRIKKEGL